MLEKLASNLAAHAKLKRGRARWQATAHTTSESALICMARRGHEKANELKVGCQLKVTGGPREHGSPALAERWAGSGWEGGTPFAHKRLRNILSSRLGLAGTFFGTQKLTRKILKKILNKKIM